MAEALAFRLNEQSERHVRGKTGMSVSDIAEMNIDQMSAKITKGRRFPFSTFSEVTDQLGRGQMYPFAGRMISREEMDRWL